VNSKEKFNKWCAKHSEFSRGELSELFGVDIRTMRRYASGETSIPIAILRMMDIFTSHGDVEREYIRKFCE
jgi:hypothetical protein